MSDVIYFDANAGYGRSVCRLPGAPYDLTGLISVLDHCKISRALVYHAGAKELYTEPANKKLLEELADEKRLIPSAVVNPGPFRSEKVMVKEVRSWHEKGIKAFRFFPLYHGVDFNDQGNKQVLEYLSDKQAAVWIDYDQPGYNYKQLGQHEQRVINFSTVEALASEYGNITFVIVGAIHGHMAKLFRLFDQFPNIRVETSLFQGCQMIHNVCKKWGAERLLFGTGLPHISPGAARAVLAYADISLDDKKKIAAGNLENLLCLPPLTSEVADIGDRSALMLDVDAGIKLDKIEVYDAHGHIAPAGSDGHLGTTFGPQDAETVILLNNRMGIDKTVISSWEIIGGNALAGNDTAWEALAKYPGRFLPLAVVNPNYPEDWQEIEKQCFGERNFFGFKPYPLMQRKRITDKGFKPMLELANERRLPILCHFDFEPLGGITSEDVKKLAPIYPNATFMIAHSGASYRVADVCIELAREFRNVFLEINYTSVPYGMMSYLINNAGEDKVLFGTDVPMRDPAAIIGWIVYDFITDVQREKILGLNFRRMCENNRTYLHNDLCSNLVV